MTATICGWCEVKAAMTVHGKTQIQAPVPYSESAWAQQTFACNNCRRLSIISTFYNPTNTNVNGDSTAWWDNRSVTWTPNHAAGKTFEDVPQHIASAADEAYQCRSIGGLRSAILLARSVIEATAKDCGISSGTLASKIDDLQAGHHIRPHTQAAAHELRFLGNDMAHGDFVEEVDVDDAEAVLDVMSEILNEVYQGPARVARMQAKRAAKNKTQA